MRWSGGNAYDDAEYGRVTVLERAEERPVLAASLVLVGWSVVVFVVVTIYGMLL